MKDFVASILAGVAVFSGVVGIFCLAIAISTAFWYYLVNFVLSVFNTGYEITWVQAFAVSLIFSVIKSIFRKSKE